MLPDLPLWRDDDQWTVDVPVAILHGRKDELVPLAESEAFVARNPQARLTVLEDDHGLLGEASLKALEGLLAEAFGQ